MHSKTAWGSALVGCLVLLMEGLVATAAHAAAGDLLWARSAGGSGWDYGWGIAVDAAGNALVTGRFQGSATFGAGEANETTLTSAGHNDIFIAKYTGVPPSEQPDLAIAKRASPLPARVGQNLTYTLTVANQGPGDATEVVVLDRPPEEVRVVSLDEGCRLVRRETAHCSLGSLVAGAETELQIVVRPEKPGLLVNRARVNAAEDDLQTSPYPVVMLLALTASSAFTTAISPVNTFVMTAGKYRFAGFIPG